MKPIATPVAATGFSPRALAVLGDQLRPIGLAPMAGAIASALASETVTAAVPPALVRSTLQAAVQFAAGGFAAPNLKRLLTDPKVIKLFHYGRFDMAMFRRHLGVMTAPVYCTKIASKLVRTYTDRHGLKDLVKELLNVDMSKEQQSSDWGAAELTELAGRVSDLSSTPGTTPACNWPVT